MVSNQEHDAFGPKVPPASEAEIAAAKAYEALHVAALFGEWAPRVADGAAIRHGDRVLDVACGTGVLGREALSRVGATGSVVGLDPNPGMLAVAAQIEPAIDWRRGTAESLPYDDGAFDTVVSQFGLMFFGDRRRAVREMLRVLRAGGRLAVAVWDALENSPAYSAEVALLDRLAGTDAANALRAPFVLGDREELSALFQAAGANSVTVTTLTGTARFPSIRSMVEADLRGWLPVMGVHLADEQVQQVLEEAEEVLGAHVVSSGEVVFAAPAHIVAGTKRGESA